MKKNYAGEQGCAAGVVCRGSLTPFARRAKKTRWDSGETDLDPLSLCPEGGGMHMAHWYKLAAGQKGVLFQEFVKKEVVAIGWPQLGRVDQVPSREALLELAARRYPDLSPAQCRTVASQVWRFCREVQPGDRIVVFDPATREYAFATVTSGYQFDPGVLSEDYPHIYRVKWEQRRVRRDDLSESARNTLGAIQTFFSIDSVAHEFQRHLGQDQVASEPEAGEEDPEAWYENVLAVSRERAADRIAKLDPWQLQDLVAGLLQAMGYRTTVSKPGRDGGIDILAHPDEFGFAEPRIKVQVKHMKQAVGAPLIQQLIGANPHDARCLFVSTGGFTTQALETAERNNVATVDLPQLVELIETYYDRLPPEIQAMVPMRRAYLCD